MAAADQPKLIVVADAEALAQAAAERVMALISANPGRIAICLTGGSSPKKLYQLLGSDGYRGKIPWDRVHWFIGDERFVPENIDSGACLNLIATSVRLWPNALPVRR